MEEILKQDKSKSHKEFEKLLTEDLESRKFKEGEITTGTVEEIGKKFVFIDLGLKSSGAIPIEEFKLSKEIDKIAVGKKIDVLLEKIENKDGEIGEFQLLKAALRERPEYIIVGEIRGAEAYVLFQAMATGHCAYSTVHADSVPSLVHRLENKPIDIPRVLIPALEACSIQIQTRINGRRVRRTKQVVEIVGIDPNSMEIITNQ